MNYLKFFRNNNLFEFENEINEFCKNYEVIATQFIPTKDEYYLVAVWYRSEEEGKPVKI